MSSKQSSRILGIWTACAVALLAAPSGAQSWGDEPTRPSQQPTRSTSSTSTGSSRALLGDSMRSQQQFTGAYVQFGANVGRIDIDDVKAGGRKQDVDTEASGGFTMTGGYRFLPWLSGEMNFSYMAGGDVEVNNVNIGDPEAWAFNFGPKLYPLGLTNQRILPEYFQPYALLGIGGGEAEVDVKRSAGKDIRRKSFTARFVTGFDLWLTDNIGAFMEGGYQVWDDDAVIGVGIWSFGAQYRF